MFNEPAEPPLAVTMELNDLMNRIEFWKKEARGFKQQMDINLRTSERYERTIQEIISICYGKAWDSPGVLKTDRAGFLEEIEIAAVRLVKSGFDKPAFSKPSPPVA